MGSSNHMNRSGRGILDYVTDIVSARVAQGRVSTKEILDLVTALHRTFMELEGAGGASFEGRLPAVPLEQSVAPHSITCLECGYSGKMIKRHLMAAHGLQPSEYRARWRLPPDYPVVAPNYAKARVAIAKSTRFGRKAPGKPDTGE